MKKNSKVLALAMASMMVFAACSKPGADKGKSGKKEEKKQEGFQVKPVVENEGTAIKGGTLNVGIISDSPFKGIFHQAFAQDGNDMSIMGWIMNGSFDVDKDYKLAKGGACDVDFKPEEKKAIIKIHPKYTWSDGVPVTSKDFLRYYLIIGDKDYKGVRYGTDYRNVVGMEEYNQGKTDKIEGVKIIDDKTFEVQFKEFDHSVLWSKGIPFEPVPDHIYKDIPVKDQAAHPATTKNPISPGPFVIQEIVPGQQVVAVANEHYFLGRPKLDKIVIKVVPSSQVVAATQSGTFDIIDGFSSDLFDKFEKLNNVKIATNHGGNYGYLSFKLGKWNDEKKMVETDPNAKMADKNLRKAMAKVIDKDAMNKSLLNGKSIPLYQIIPPYFKTINSPDFEGLRFNVEEAKKLLDEAGFKDVNNDGIREDKNGKPLEIKYAAMQSGATSEPTAQYFIQQWKSIGLNVSLVDGRLLDFNVFYEKLQKDDPGIDIYQAGWNTGSNPDPTGFYGKYEGFNLLRFTSPELDKLLANLVSLDNMDEAKRKEHYIALSKYMVEDEAIVIPLFSGTQKVVVNNRVKKYDISSPEDGKTPFRNADIELISDQPVK